MAKYSFELKKKIVLEYLNEEVGYTTLAQKYGIPAIKSIERGYITIILLEIKACFVLEKMKPILLKRSFLL